MIKHDLIEVDTFDIFTSEFMEDVEGTNRLSPMHLTNFSYLVIEYQKDIGFNGRFRLCGTNTLIK